MALVRPSAGGEIALPFSTKSHAQANPEFNQETKDLVLGSCSSRSSGGSFLGCYRA